MDRLATLLTADYERSPVPPGAAVSDYLAALGRAHDVFIDIVADAGSSVAGAPGELGRVVADQARLTRQFLDAQRTIVRYWAEVDAEIADLLERSRYGTDQFGADSGVLGQGARQPDGDPSAELRSLLDLWWRREHLAGKELIADAVLATRHGSPTPVTLASWPPPVVPPPPTMSTRAADSPAPDDPTGFEPSMADPPAGRSTAEILSAFMDVRADDLLATIDALLASRPSERAAAAFPPPIAPPFAPPLVLPFPPPTLERDLPPAVASEAVVADPAHDERSSSRADDDAAFARFWNASRDTRRSSRPQLEAVVSLLSMLVVLTVVLAWIG